MGRQGVGGEGIVYTDEVTATLVGEGRLLDVELLEKGEPFRGRAFRGSSPKRASGGPWGTGITIWVWWEPSTAPWK